MRLTLSLLGLLLMYFSSLWAADALATRASGLMAGISSAQLAAAGATRGNLPTLPPDCLLAARQPGGLTLTRKAECLNRINTNSPTPIWPAR